MSHKQSVTPSAVAQDCGSKVTGTEPGPGAMVIYPAPVTLSTAREGLETASATLAKYPAELRLAIRLNNSLNMILIRISNINIYDIILNLLF